jgi:hypothetical protein
MIWFYSKNGQQLGPISDEEIVNLSKSGGLTATDLVWKEGMPDWKPWREVSLLSSNPTPPNMPAIPQSFDGNVMVRQPSMHASIPVRPNIPTYLWQSIVATVLCCMPFGVVAIVYAAKVDSLIAVGDYVGAQSASDSAKIWVGVSVGIFLLTFVGYFVLFGIFAAGTL